MSGGYVSSFALSLNMQGVLHRSAACLGLAAGTVGVPRLKRIF